MEGVEGLVKWREAVSIREGLCPRQGSEGGSVLGWMGAVNVLVVQMVVADVMLVGGCQGQDARGCHRQGGESCQC